LAVVQPPDAALVVGLEPAVDVVLCLTLVTTVVALAVLVDKVLADPEPGVQVLSQPEHALPALLVLPPAYTVGPGATYVLIDAWMLTRIPGSDAL
jgi:hypothetical protein